LHNLTKRLFYRLATTPTTSTRTCDHDKVAARRIH
jgi:hypothetical protein